MSFVIHHSLYEKTWRAFVDEQPDGNIFHTPEMAQVFRRVTGQKPVLWACLSDDGRVQALLPTVEVTLIGGPLRPLTTRAIAYGGAVCCQSQAGRDALAFLLQDYIRKKKGEVLFTELRNLADAQSLQAVLRQHHFEYEDHLDYLIALNCSTEQVLMNIGSRTRKHIRKGLRKGVVQVEELTGRQQLKEWYALVQKTYEAAQVPLADRALFEAAFDVLYPRGMIKFWAARIGPALVAASAELLYKDVVYGWYGGVDRRYADEVPGELLMWHILAWGAENGYRIYDFGGAGKPSEAYGVREFKAKFGGALVCFGRNAWVPRPWLLNLSKEAYQVYRKFI